MNKIFGKYFACSMGNAPVLLNDIDLTKENGVAYYSDVKTYGVRPKNIYTGDTSGIIDELSLTSYDLNGKQVIIGTVEFRMCAYLYYQFDPQDEELIKNKSITREEFFKRNPIV